MTDTTKTRKAKRILTNIDFSGENSHIALCSKSNPPANGADYTLVLKASNFSPEYITKIQAVQVTLPLPEFLERFFNVYGTQGEILARMMGYEEPEDASKEDFDYDDYIQSKVDSFTILKSVNDAVNKADVLSTLSQEQYLSLVQDQAKLEKALEAIQKESDELAQAAQTDTSKIMHEVNDGVSAPEVKLTKSKAEKAEGKGKTMTKPVEGQAPEMVEKSQLTALEKAVLAGQEALTKAQATIAEFELKQKEQITKSKTAQFAAVVKDEKILTPVIKAALALEQEDFDALLTAITGLVQEADKQKEQLEKSALFTEQGASTSEENTTKESAVARILKSQLNKVGA